MSDHKKNASIRRFLADRINSYEKLTIVVHLSGAGGAALTMVELATACALPVKLVAEALTALLRDDVVRSSAPNGGRWSIDPEGPNAATIDALARCYVEDPVDVLRTITEVAMHRVRSMTAQRFADAFLIVTKRKMEDPDA